MFLSRTECCRRLNEWAMMYLGTEIGLDENVSTVRILQCLVLLFQNQNTVRGRKIVVFMMFYFLSSEKDFLKKHPRLEQDMQQKCHEFVSNGLYLGHFIGVPQETSTVSISELVDGFMEEGECIPR
jgi:hypothetical protein